MDKVVLLVEDNSDDVFLLREVIKLYSLSVKLIVIDDGEKAIDWVRRNDADSQKLAPAAIILDINLPKRNGAEVLEVIRGSSSLRLTPVIIFSSSNTFRDRSLGDRYPRTRYVRKSADFDEFSTIGSALKQVFETYSAPQ